MNQNLISISPDFPSLFHVANASQTLPMPFAREISLLECHIAGTNFRPDIHEIEPYLKIGAVFKLQREPENTHDQSAIAVYDAENSKLGYIPKTRNEVLAKLLDAGKLMSAKLIAKEWQDSWLKLDIKIFLHD